MTELIKQAIDKIDKEAEKINNTYITSKVVQRIIDTMLINDANARILLNILIIKSVRTISQPAKK